MSTVPISTYRLQVSADFTLHAATELVDYLTDLGVDWIYLSPVLQATKGSTHGYDVVDHSSIDAERGGNAALDVFSQAAHAAGHNVLIDIVPNHMGVSDPSQNAWWWDLLTLGRASRYAEAFDIDWDFSPRLRIPVLGDGEALGDLRVENGRLHYFDNAYPLAPGTADDGADAATVHSRQHYELVHWSRADSELSYRRFFAVNTLAAIRVEVPWVFEESHEQIVRWVREGIADGLRIDHPDGLRDPGAYLDELAVATDNTYVLVEKILEGDEQLPAFWPVAGTTGYDALADIDRILIDRAGRSALDALDTELRGRAQPVEWSTMIRLTKRGIADTILHSEVLRLERDYLAQHPPLPMLADALAELLACFPVYRSYLPSGVEHLHESAVLSKRARPELSATIDALVPILSDPENEVAQRFQQTSGMVMAKGVEDTAFYRYTRLGSLTEVGADPSEFAIGVTEFHRRQLDRQARFPASMTTLSTHDTKRGEDTRARINVLSELPEEWSEVLGRLRENAPLGDGPLENLLWESIVGAWPASADRLHAYAEKAAREAGNSTTWTSPDEDFESRMHRLIDSAFESSIVPDFVARIEQFGWSNSLAAKLIQLTAPGVPDVYQGSELWETSLVDPDNRRAVDYDLRRLYLAAINAGAHPPIDESGAAKLLVTSRALTLRLGRPELFTRYAPLEALGSAAEHAVAFDRGGAVTVATRLPAGLERRGGWDDTIITVPGRRHVDVISDVEYEGGSIRLAELLAKYPVALLAPVEAQE
ncbi:MAG: malto-oligosyltrehalose synthase [Microbacteriaceae bacterium]